MVTLAILFVINPMLPVLLLAAGFLTAFQSNFFSAWGVHTKLPGSYVTFRVNDTSTNNKIIQFFSIGEGLHNNHHKFPQYYDQAMLSHEVDPAGWIIKKLFIGEVK
jgi:fatty-acid desaturase